MARRKRGYRITGAEYTFGAGVSTENAGSGTLRIYKGNPNSTSANYGGMLSSGDTWEVKMDASSAIQGPSQYIYFDNAFEYSTGTISYEYMNGDTAVPAGTTVATGNDGVDGGIGYFRLSGTPSTEGTNTIKVKYANNTGDYAEIFYKLTRFPAGTTPVFSTSINLERLIRNLSGKQVLVDAPTTTYSGAVWSLKDVSGFAAGVTPIVNPSTGEVYVNNLGDVVAEAADHTFTLVGDFGPEIGTFEQVYTASIAYGDPYGARYFGPANTNQNITSSANFSSSVASSDGVCNPKKSTGALRRYTDNRQDTSPYLSGDGYGCIFRNNMSSYVSQSTYDDLTTAYVKNGTMGFASGSSQMWSSGANHGYVLFRWVVPNGVFSISMVAVGGGGPGMYNWSANGGGGGGLAWLNGVDVTPGQEFQICVGLGRYSEANNSSYGAGPSWVRDLTTGDCLIYGQGGGWHGHTSSNPNGQNTSYTGGVSITGINQWTARYNSNTNEDGGGWGVNSNYGKSVNGFHYGGGTGQYCNGYSGGGAGGYRGASSNAYNASAGLYGGGGGGWYYSSTYGTSAGGGVGLDGQGWGGASTTGGPDSSVHAGSGYGGNSGAWTSFASGSSAYAGGGGGGSGGSRGSFAQNSQTSTQGEYTGQRSTPGGVHGGGGGGSGTSWGGGHGAPGGVRIIWGIGADGTERCFPYNYASERPDMKVAGTL